MKPPEQKTVLAIASIYASRMLGLFIILPIFSLYTQRLPGATATLAGLALGIYGLTQAVLQIPFAMCSDRIGRKPVIIFGLLLFALGSVIAAMSHSIYGIIVGRALQGAGAIGSTLIALLADTTHDESRLKAMTLIGMVIGLSFVLAMVLGPIVNSFVGLSGIFWLTAILALGGIVILLVIVPTPKTHLLHRDSETVLSQFKNTLTTPELLRLDFGIFALHAILMALFIIIPITLMNHSSLTESQQWMFYLPILFIASMAMLPFVLIAESKRLIKPLFIAAIFVLIATAILLSLFFENILAIGIILCLFFTAFTFLEACLPSLITKIARAGNKGTAMGIYSSAQFFGVFFGGAVGGLLFNHWGYNSIFIFCGILGLIWAVLACTMQAPPYLSAKVVSLQEFKGSVATLESDLLAVPGIKDVMICWDEQVAYLKVDKHIFSETDLAVLLNN